MVTIIVKAFICLLLKALLKSFLYDFVALLYRYYKQNSSKSATTSILSSYHTFEKFYHISPAPCQVLSSLILFVPNFICVLNPTYQYRNIHHVFNFFSILFHKIITNIIALWYFHIK